MGCARSQLIFIDPGWALGWKERSVGVTFHSQSVLPREDLGSRKFESGPL